jgi:hypothetical protein
MASTNLSRTVGTPTAQKFTFSAWIKRSKIGLRQGIYKVINPSSTSSYGYLEFDSNDTLNFDDFNGGSSRFTRVSNAVFRDVNSWYHIVVSMNATGVANSEKAKIYINGEEISYLSQTNDSLSSLSTLTSGKTFNLGSHGQSNLYFDGLMSHVHFIDGTVYTPSAFGETDSTTGEWKIKTDVSVTYGNNGFFILKDGNSVTDQSGNGNNFTVAGGTLTNTEDNPSNVFCTWNPLIPSDLDYANGNTDVQQTSNTDWEATKGTLGFTEGKYYWEVKISSNSGDPWDSFHGIAGENAITSGATYDATPSVIFKAGGAIDVDGTLAQSGLGQSSDGDIIGIAVDADNSNIDFYRNGTQVGTTQALSSNSGFWLPFSGFAGNRTAQANFGNGYFGTTAVSSAGTNASGNGIFEYDVPTGYTALSTKGLNL